MLVDASIKQNRGDEYGAIQTVVEQNEENSFKWTSTSSKTTTHNHAMLLWC